MIKQLLLICLVTDNLDQYLEFQFRLSIYRISSISPPGIGGLSFPVVLDWGLIKQLLIYRNRALRNIKAKFYTVQCSLKNS